MKKHIIASLVLSLFATASIADAMDKSRIESSLLFGAVPVFQTPDSSAGFSKDEYSMMHKRDKSENCFTPTILTYKLPENMEQNLFLTAFKINSRVNDGKCHFSIVGLNGDISSFDNTTSLSIYMREYLHDALIFIQNDHTVSLVHISIINLLEKIEQIVIQTQNDKCITNIGLSFTQNAINDLHAISICFNVDPTFIELAQSLVKECSYESVAQQIKYDNSKEEREELEKKIQAEEKKIPQMKYIKSQFEERLQDNALINAHQLNKDKKAELEQLKAEKAKQEQGKK